MRHGPSRIRRKFNRSFSASRRSSSSSRLRADAPTLTILHQEIKKPRLPPKEKVTDLETSAREILARAGSESNVTTMLETIKRYSGLIGNYSPFNAVLIYWQDPNATIVHSKKDWERMGKRVRENAKPIEVLIPIGGGRHVSQPEVAHLIQEGKKQGLSDEMIEHKVMQLLSKDSRHGTHTFSVGTVYDAKSVEGGESIPKHEKLRAQHMYELTKRYAKDQYDVEEGGAYQELGFSNLVRDENGGLKGHIKVMKVPGESIQPLSTLAHEIAHHQLGHTRLANQEYLKNRGKYEAEAQLASYLVLSHYGIDDTAHSSAYISGWLRKQPLGEEAVDRSMNAARKIINGIEEKKLDLREGRMG
jgi:hypothetical protein